MVASHLSAAVTAARSADTSSARVHQLGASPETCFWGYFDRDMPTVLEIESGDIVEIEAVTHHSGDAPDLLMDEGVEVLWQGIPQAERGPGAHIMTGPITVADAEPGDTLLVNILDMRPRMPYGSNCAANWGLLYDTFQKERITIYELTGDSSTGFTATAEPRFGFDYVAFELYDKPGTISPVDEGGRQPFSVPVKVPVRPHFGVMGVSPEASGRVSSTPPSVYGGNVDNWRLGPGAAMAYPVFVEGAGLFVGDPHFAQGDGEICGTAIEASINARIQVFVIKDVRVTSPILDNEQQLITHGFSDDLDKAMRMAAEQMLWLLCEQNGMTADDAYSLCSVAIDLGVTQVVDRTLGCHAILNKAIFDV